MAHNNNDPSEKDDDDGFGAVTVRRLKPQKPMATRRSFSSDIDDDDEGDSSSVQSRDRARALHAHAPVRHSLTGAHGGTATPKSRIKMSIVPSTSSGSLKDAGNNSFSSLPVSSFGTGSVPLYGPTITPTNGVPKKRIVLRKDSSSSVSSNGSANSNGSRGFTLTPKLKKRENAQDMEFWSKNHKSLGQLDTIQLWDDTEDEEEDLFANVEPAKFSHATTTNTTKSKKVKKISASQMTKFNNSFSGFSWDGSSEFTVASSDKDSITQPHKSKRIAIKVRRVKSKDNLAVGSANSNGTTSTANSTVSGGSQSPHSGGKVVLRTQSAQSARSRTPSKRVKRSMSTDGGLSPVRTPKGSVKGHVTKSPGSKKGSLAKTDSERTLQKSRRRSKKSSTEDDASVGSEQATLSSVHATLALQHAVTARKKLQDLLVRQQQALADSQHAESQGASPHLRNLTRKKLREGGKEPTPLHPRELVVDEEKSRKPLRRLGHCSEYRLNHLLLLDQMMLESDDQSVRSNRSNTSNRSSSRLKKSRKNSQRQSLDVATAASFVNQLSDQLQQARRRLADRVNAPKESSKSLFCVKLVAPDVWQSRQGPAAAADVSHEIALLRQLDAHHPNVAPIYAIHHGGLEETIANMAVEGSSEEVNDTRNSRSTQSIIQNSFFWVTDCVEELLIDRIDRWRDKKGYSTVTTSSSSSKLSQRLEVALDIASALVFLHERKVVHHVRPNKVGFDGRQVVKLCSFAEARLDGSTQHSQNLTKTKDMSVLAYTAPEVLCKAPVTTSSDVYSFGILLWEVMSLKDPYGDVETAADHMESVVKGHQRPKLQKKWPTEFKKLLPNCWHPFTRTTMKKAHEELADMLLF